MGKYRPLEEMTEVEKLDEILVYLRGLADVLEAASSNPMLSMMIPDGMPKIGS